ncbi:MAG: hypothetical protein ACLFU0_05830 [Alphaproteobacteria bacterium]
MPLGFLLLLPPRAAGIYVFAALMGVWWPSTVPPPSGLVAVTFGVCRMAMRFAIVVFSHQLDASSASGSAGRRSRPLATLDPVSRLTVVLRPVAAARHEPIRAHAAPLVVGA